MLPLTICALSVLACANYRIGGKAALFPPFVFSTVWAADLLLVWMAGDFFYPLSAETLAIFLGGALALSVGSWIALGDPRRSRPAREAHPEISNRIINSLIVLLLLGSPFFVRWVLDQASQYGAPTIFAAARIAMLHNEEQPEAGSSIFNNLLTLSLILATITFCEMEKNRKRAAIIVLLALALIFMTGQRGGIVALILYLVGVDWMKNRRIRWKMLSVMLLIFLITFASLAIYIGKGDARADASLAENAVPVAQGFVLYAAGGLIAFDRVVREPGIVPHNWRIDMFFLNLLHPIDPEDFEAPHLHAEYVPVGAGLDENIYTIYFAYFDYGYAGMMGMLFLLGFLATLLYKRALLGSKISLILYGVFFSGLVLSIFSEDFFLILNYIVKLFATSWLIYSLPAAWYRLRDFLKRAATEAPSALHFGR